MVRSPVLLRVFMGNLPMNTMGYTPTLERVSPNQGP